MANPLTGDYEGVVQIAARQMNALLGTLHQNAAIPNTALKLLHSATVRIGDRPRRPPEVDVFGDWLLEYQRTGPGLGLRDVRTQLTATAPPGVARMLSDALMGFDQDWEVELPPDVVRGLAKVQVSSVTLTVPDGSSSEIIVNASIRAHYYPDPGTTVIPTQAHGDLRIAFDVRRLQRPSGTRLLIQPSSQDSKIQFTAAPGTGLDAAAQNRIAAEIRKVLREGLTQVPVDLPANFPFADFKGLASGSSQAIALPFQLSGAAPPAGGLQSLTQAFVGPVGFAFAVSKEYVISLIDIEAIRAAMASRSEPVLTATYRFRFSSGPTLTFRNGGFEISGQVEAEIQPMVGAERLCPLQAAGHIGAGRAEPDGRARASRRSRCEPFVSHIAFHIARPCAENCDRRNRQGIARERAKRQTRLFGREELLCPRAEDIRSRRDGVIHGPRNHA